MLSPRTLARTATVATVLVCFALSAGSAEARVRVPKPNWNKVGTEVSVNVGSSALYDAGKAALKKLKDTLKPRECGGNSGTAGSTPQFCR